MAPIRTQCLNFILTGEVRSGTSAIQSAVSNRAGAVCHRDLMHPCEEIRKLEHQTYFGVGKPGKIDEWFNPEISPWQYISKTVFDNPQDNEKTIGMRILYPEVRAWDLCDLFNTKHREGDFCLIHVKRNPVACFISLKQAERFNIWTRGLNSPRTSGHISPIAIEIDELTAFCREHFATMQRINQCCEDRLEVPYHDLVVYYQETMRKVFDFIELPDVPEPAAPTILRIRNNRAIDERITNMDVIRKKAPSDISRLLDAEDLF